MAKTAPHCSSPKTAPGPHLPEPQGVVPWFEAAEPGTTRPGAVAASVEAWLQALRSRDPSVGSTHLLERKVTLGSWARTADEIGHVLTYIGEAWARGELSIAEEHGVTDRLTRALARVAEWMPVAEDAPRCLLVSAEGDEHTLGLRLADLCLRSCGYLPVWTGSPRSRVQLSELFETHRPRLVAVSASRYSRSAQVLARQVEVLAAHCRAHGAQLVLGGTGSWPANVEATVCRDFGELDSFLRSPEASAPLR